MENLVKSLTMNLLKILQKITKKKSIFAFEDLQIYFKFYSDHFEIFDSTTNRKMLVNKLEKEFDSITLDKKRNILYLLKSSKIVISIQFTPFKRINTVTTKAEYIVQIGQANENLFYVGVYEFGILKLINDKLSILKHVEHDSLSYGIFDEINNKFFVARGPKGIESWDWSKEKPEILWSNKNFIVIKGLVLTSKNTLFVGTNLGDILHFDGEGRQINKFKFESESIRHMVRIDGKDDFICLTNKNYVYKFNFQGTLLWKTILNLNTHNNSISIIDKNLLISTNEGIGILMNSRNGKIKKTYRLKKDVFAPILIINNKWIVYSSPEMVNFETIDRNENANLSIRFSDRMIRALLSVEKGILVGDDYGKISFISTPDLKVLYFDTTNETKSYSI